jgi:hypothetical protein
LGTHALAYCAHRWRHRGDFIDPTYATISITLYGSLFCHVVNCQTHLFD